MSSRHSFVSFLAAALFATLALGLIASSPALADKAPAVEDTRLTPSFDGPPAEFPPSLALLRAHELRGIIGRFVASSPALADKAPAVEDTRLTPSFDGPPAEFPPSVAQLRASELRGIIGRFVAGPAGTNGTASLPSLQSECSVAASGLQVVAGFNDFRGSTSLSGVIRSADGGNTFTDAGGSRAPAAPRPCRAIPSWRCTTRPAVRRCSTTPRSSAPRPVR